MKLLGFDDFYRKLFLRISGTYYTPEIRPVFILAAVAAAALLITAIICRHRPSPRAEAAVPHPAAAGLAAAGSIGVNIGILVIGKYSAPSAVFVIPFLVILITAALEHLPARLPRLLFTTAAVVILAFNSALSISDELRTGDSFREFNSQIEAAIPAADSRVLGPLTAEYALEYAACSTGATSRCCAKPASAWKSM